MFVARPDDGMTIRGYKLRLQTDSIELVHQPVCTFDQFFLVLIVSRDAGKPQERIILLEIIVAHGGKLLKLPRSARVSRAQFGALAEVHESTTRAKLLT